MQVTITDIEDGVVIQDSSIWGISTDSNYGSNNVGVIGSIISKPLKYIIKVDLSSYAEVVPTLTKFSINIASADDPVTDVYWHRVLRPWVEDQVTWNDYITATNWNVAGCNGTGEGSDREESSQNILPLVIDSLAWYDLDCLPSSVESDLGGYFSILVSDTLTPFVIGVNSTEAANNRPSFYMEYTETTVPVTLNNISKKDKKILSDYSDIAYDSPDAIEGSPKLREEEIKEVSGNVQFYLEQYEAILDATEKMTAIIDDRCSGYTLVFDQIERPDLASAVKRVFGLDTNEITYEMYKEVIEEQIKLNNEIGDEIFGQ